MSQVWQSTYAKQIQNEKGEWKPSHAKMLVMLKLADHANDFGVCYPSQKLIANQCGLNRTTVNHIIRMLEKDGKLFADRKQHYLIYHLRFDNLDVASGNTSDVVSGNISTVSDVVSGNTDVVSGNTDVVSGNTNHKESSINQEREETPPALKGDSEPETSSHSTNFLTAYENVFPANPLPIFQQELIESRITDLGAWTDALAFWHSNNYRPQSIGKICDKYDELLNAQRKKTVSGELPTPDTVKKQVEEFKQNQTRKLPPAKVAI
jgi:biotin operon repressor